MESKLSENYFQANTGGVDAVVFQVFQASFFILHKLTLPGITSHQIKTSMKNGTELLVWRSAIICAVKIKKTCQTKIQLARRLQGFSCHALHLHPATFRRPETSFSFFSP